MSTPKAPYFYKESGSDAYHWETSCSKKPLSSPRVEEVQHSPTAKRTM